MARQSLRWWQVNLDSAFQCPSCLPPPLFTSSPDWHRAAPLRSFPVRPSSPSSIASLHTCHFPQGRPFISSLPPGHLTPHKCLFPTSSSLSLSLSPPLPLLIFNTFKLSGYSLSLSILAVLFVPLHLRPRTPYNTDTLPDALI